MLLLYYDFPPAESRMENQLGKKRACSESSNAILRHGHRLEVYDCPSLSRARFVPQAMRRVVRKGAPSTSVSISEAARSDDGSLIGDSAGPAANAACPAMVQCSPSASCQRQAQKVESDSKLFACAETVERARHVSLGGTNWPSLLSYHFDHRRVKTGLGRCLPGEISERGLDVGAEVLPHKCARTPGSPAGVNSLSRTYHGVARTDQVGQYGDGSVYKPSRGVAIPVHDENNERGAVVGPQSSSLTQSHSPSREVECGGRHVITRGADLGRVALTPESNSFNLATFRPSTGGLVRHERIDSLSSMVFDTGQRRALGDRRSSESMAEIETICVSAHSFDSSCAGQSQIGADLANISSPALGEPGVVRGSNSADARLPMGNPSEQRFAFPSERISSAPVPAEVEVVGLAPEREYLLNAGLSSAVVSTIQSARAVSTRSLYSLKWRAFQRWCAQKGEAPSHCEVGVILEFLQELFDKGLSPSTLKVYVAAISACHVSTGQSSIGNHALISRFMKGVRRLRPVEPLRAPSWDLSLVLRALTEPPFEPLDAVDVRIMSFKTALLLALVSAKRVSELHAVIAPVMYYFWS